LVPRFWQGTQAKLLKTCWVADISTGDMCERVGRRDELGLKGKIRRDVFGADAMVKPWWLRELKSGLRAGIHPGRLSRTVSQARSWQGLESAGDSAV